MRHATSTIDGHVAQYRLGALRVATHRGSAPYVLENPEPGQAGDTALVGVGTQPDGRAILSHRGLLLPCAPGEAFVVDMSQPWQLRQLDDFRLHLHLVPRSLVGLSDEDLASLWGVHGRSGDGVTRLLVPLLTTTAESAPSYAHHIAHSIVGSLADLLSTMATERKVARRAAAVRPARQDERAATAQRIRHFVNENLADRALSPEHIAAHHHVSVRHVHQVFTGEGTTLSRWISRRRLEECRRELARHDPESASSVAAVARRWGFANPTHFSRSFRAEYGISPSEWQRIRTTGGVESAERGRQLANGAGVGT
jgi:AraC-like DNA-binding protein